MTHFQSLLNQYCRISCELAAAKLNIKDGGGGSGGRPGAQNQDVRHQRDDCVQDLLGKRSIFIPEF